MPCIKNCYFWRDLSSDDETYLPPAEQIETPRSRIWLQINFIQRSQSESIIDAGMAQRNFIKRSQSDSIINAGTVRRDLIRHSRNDSMINIGEKKIAWKEECLEETIKNDRVAETINNQNGKLDRRALPFVAIEKNNPLALKSYLASGGDINLRLPAKSKKELGQSLLEYAVNRYFETSLRPPDDACKEIVKILLDSKAPGADKIISSSQAHECFLTPQKKYYMTRFLMQYAIDAIQAKDYIDKYFLAEAIEIALKENLIEETSKLLDAGALDRVDRFNRSGKLRKDEFKNIVEKNISKLDKVIWERNLPESRGTLKETKQLWENLKFLENLRIKFE